MDGVHDLGGTAGFGPVVIEPDEPVFHEPWEATVFGVSLSLMAAGTYGGPRFRHAIERMHPVHHLASSYYEHWMTAFATLLVEDGTVDHDELERRAGAFPLSGPLHPDPLVFAGPARARFAVGDAVVVVDAHPMGHTRCPDYVRGHTGTVVAQHRPSNVPDLEGHGGTLVPEVSYAVRFGLRELWGDDGAGADSVVVDLYDRYLEAT